MAVKGLIVTTALFNSMLINTVLLYFTVFCFVFCFVLFFLAESCRQLLPSACIVKEEQALKMMHGAALVQRCLATALSVCELMKQ